MTSTVTLHIGDVRDVMAELPDNAFDLLVTSPPFLALRSYLPADHPDKSREIGSEPTPANFIDTLLGLTADWGRLLPEWASICVELGDTMSGSGGAGGDYNPDGLREGQLKFRQRTDGGRYPAGYLKNDGRRTGQAEPTGGYEERPTKGSAGWPLAKSMCDIPHLYSSSLEYGWNLLNPAAGPSPAGQWRVRNKICWARPNPPVGSLGKRNPHTRTGDYKFRPATSYITVACRGTGRYFDLDAVRTPWSPTTSSIGRVNGGVSSLDGGTRMGARFDTKEQTNPAGAPPLDWHTDHLDGDWLWKLATAPYKGAHYATFPLTLPRRLIQAMCPLRVCQSCGWPSERVQITGDQTALGAHIRERRQALALPIKALAEHFPSRTGGLTGCVSNWENGDNIPTPEQWAILKRLLTLDDRFDSFVLGQRTTTEYVVGGTNGTKSANHTHGPSYTHRAEAIRSDLGWTDCGHNNWRTGRVLDCFGGSGTAAVAAALEHRDATLIDLDERNVALVDRRLRENVRILDMRRDGNTITWTVDVVSTAELAADEAGQLGLFG